MIRVLAVIAASVLALALLAELLAGPLVARRATTELRRCLTVDRVEVTGLARPAVPRLLAGELREVSLRAEGLRIGDLRVDEATTTVPRVTLPWSRAAPEPVAGVLEATVTEADAEAWAAARVPGGVTPIIEFEDGAVAVGVAPLPARVRVALAVRDGQLVLDPAGALPGWFSALGIDLVVPLPGDRAVDALQVRPGHVDAQLHYVIEPAGERQLACPEPRP